MDHLGPNKLRGRVVVEVFRPATGLVYLASPTEVGADCASRGAHSTARQLCGFPQCGFPQHWFGDTVALDIGSRGFFFNPVTLTSADLMLPGGAGVQPVWSVLQQCGVLEDHIDNIPTMLLPQPIATLLFAGAWSDLVCLARWRLRFWPEWPPQAWIQEFTINTGGQEMLRR